MVCCAYRDCQNSSSNCSLSFYRFPPKSKGELRKKWLLNCGLEIDFDRKGLRICSDHFERNFKHELLGTLSQKKLKDKAVPCITRKNENFEEHVEEACFPNNFNNPHGVLEDFADFALNENYFNNLKNQNGKPPGLTEHYLNILRKQNGEPPVELIVPQQVNNIHHQVNNIPQQVNNVPQQVNNVPQQVNNVPQQVNNVPQPVISTSVSGAPSSLPASQNWPGEYDFNVTFHNQEKASKSLTWTYSKVMDKIYVNKDAPCPVNFSTNTRMPENVVVRAMALYSCPENASEIVTRCSNHCSDEKKTGVYEAEHLVRCESPNAAYEVDPITKRHSVKVPFENPPIGQFYSTYIYKFTCYGSCPFGPNRRPLMFVFTLEQGGEVLGRRVFDLKICACPGRDRKSDETQAMLAKGGIPPKRKNIDHVDLHDTFNFTKSLMFPVPKIRKMTNDQEEGKRTLIVEDPECYKFLIQMKKFYECVKAVKETQQRFLQNNKNLQPKKPGSDA